MKDYKNKHHVIVHMRACKDLLDPNLWIYWGKVNTSKKAIKDNIKRHKDRILHDYNAIYKTEFTHITVD